MQFTRYCNAQTYMPWKQYLPTLKTRSGLLARLLLEPPFNSLALVPARALLNS